MNVAGRLCSVAKKQTACSNRTTDMAAATAEVSDSQACAMQPSAELSTTAATLSTQIKPRDACVYALTKVKVSDPSKEIANEWTQKCLLH